MWADVCPLLREAQVESAPADHVDNQSRPGTTGCDGLLRLPVWRARRLVASAPNGLEHLGAPRRPAGSKHPVQQPDRLGLTIDPPGVGHGQGITTPEVNAAEDVDLE